jgi:DNA invertase Pin-like site-specific DNA recombinase
MENPVIKNVYAYVRVSTRSQSYEGQVENIKKYCSFKDYNLVNVFEDTGSGKDTEREGFQRMLRVLDQNENPQGISCIISTKLDRVGRSLYDLLKFSTWCKDRKIDLVFTQSNIDTSSPENRMFFQLMAMFSEFERERIAERTSEGRVRFVLGGGKLGKPRKQIPVEEIRKLLELGVPKTHIAKKFKCSLPTIYDRLKEK